jgi:hypothetical protein
MSSLPKMDGKRRGKAHRFRLGDALDDWRRLLQRAKRHLSDEEYDDFIASTYSDIADLERELRESDE